MTEFERYLFELQGFLVIENVLNSDEIAALQSLLDQLPQRSVFKCILGAIALYWVTMRLYRVLPLILRVPLRLPPLLLCV